MKDYLIVDGYNVINGWPELKELAQKNLEHARLRLLDILANYRGVTHSHTIVVFDAHSVKGQKERTDFYHGIEVIYSRENETADSVIERLANVNRDKRIYVVTSDWEEQRVVFGSGAYRVSVRQLREDYLRTERELKQAMENKFSPRSLESRLSEDVKKIMELWRRTK